MFDYLNSDIKQIFARIQGKTYQKQFICQEISFFDVLKKFLDFLFNMRGENEFPWCGNNLSSM